MNMMGGQGNGSQPNPPPGTGPRALSASVNQTDLPPSGGSMPPSGTPDNGNMPALNGMGNMNSIWPLWGYLVVPSLLGIILGLSILGLFFVVVWNFVKNDKKVSPFVITLFAYVILFVSNLIGGWDTGIVATIGANSEIYTDAIQITSVFTFISQFESLQATLSIHAQTQPPGAVIFIYLLYIIFQTPGIMAIALSLIATFGSAYFINGIFTRLFDKETAKYGLLLFLILPAVSVYYLANLYAIVATITFGALYFYLNLDLPVESNSNSETLKHRITHKQYIGNFIGVFLCLVCLSFLTYLFVWEIMFLGLLEILKLWHMQHQNWSAIKNQGFINSLKIYLGKLIPLILICGGIIGYYVVLYFTLSYNYIDSFLYASTLENPDGFMLFANPGNYFLTRLDDILDIIYFFGPVLTVLLIQGIKNMKNSIKESSSPQLMLLSQENISSQQNPEQSITNTITQTTTQIVISPKVPLLEQSSEQNQKQFNYLLVISALLALGILFLTGAPKKGETARICLFILPFLLMPVLYLLKSNNISRKEKGILLICVISQSIIMQMFGYFIW
jgi:hypothetical protein